MISLLRDMALTPRYPGVVQSRIRARNWGEREALALVMIACIFSLIIRFPSAMEIPLGEMRRDTQLGSFVAANLLFAPLFMYLLAAILRMVLALSKRPIEWRDARILFFWTLLAFQPLIAIFTIVTNSLDSGNLANLLSLALFLNFLVALWFGSGAYVPNNAEQRT